MYFVLNNHTSFTVKVTYIANEDGGGCDWDGWAELFLSKGQKGCLSPMIVTPTEYASLGNLDFSLLVPSKILLGLIIDAPPNAKRLDASVKARADALISQYGGGGSMIWVVPGWGANPNAVSDLISLGYTMNPTECNSNACANPFQCTSSTKNCGASDCGKAKTGATDESCQSCKGGQSWPCSLVGACQDQSQLPKCL